MILSRNLPARFRLLAWAVIIGLSFRPGGLHGEAMAKWEWDQQLPSMYRMDGAPTRRTTKEADEFFRAHQRTVKEVLEGFGDPDAYSRQRMWSYKEGTVRRENTFAVFRFLLKDGGEFQVRVYGDANVTLAIRYDAKGRGHLLWK